MSRTKECACTVRVNAADCISTKCTWRLEIDTLRLTPMCLSPDAVIILFWIHNSCIPKMTSFNGHLCENTTHMWKFRFWFPMSQQFVRLQIVLKAPGSRNETNTSLNTSATNVPAGSYNWKIALTSFSCTDWFFNAVERRVVPAPELHRLFKALLVHGLLDFLRLRKEKRISVSTALLSVLPVSQSRGSVCQAEGI